MHRLSKFKNGLTYISVPVSGTKAATFLVMVPIGSRYENKKLNGASHFVEHLMFKGTEKRPTTLDISRELDAVGAQFNAYTNKEYTGYFIKIDSAKEELAMDILSDMIFNSRFDAGEVQKEKGVIIEEIKMYEDNPMAAVEDLIEKNLFGDSPLGWNIAGTKKGIGKMSRQELFSYYKSVYAPKNMVLVAAGKINGKTARLAQKYFGQKRSQANLTKEKFLKFRSFKKAALSGRVLSDKRKIDQAHTIIAFPGIKSSDPRRYALSVLLNILGGGMSSRLFVEVREKRGLAYRVRADASLFRDTGAVYISSGLDQGRLQEAFRVIKAEIKKISSLPVTKKELADAKNCLSGHLTLAMEDSRVQAEWFAEKFWFDSNLESFTGMVKKIRKVTAAQILRLAKEIFREDIMRVAVISSKEKSNILKLI